MTTTDLGSEVQVFSVAIRVMTNEAMTPQYGRSVVEDLVVRDEAMIHDVGQ